MNIGDRVELHPATDTWMRGDRWGTVLKVNRLTVVLVMDVSNRKLLVRKTNLKDY